MKRTQKLPIVLLAGALLLPAVASAEHDVTNRLSFSARLGFNIGARLKGIGGGMNLPTPSSRTTPRGDAYNYDDGYVLTDVSGNFGGQTWYWGYDNSASQVSGNSILLSRSTAAGAPSSRSLDNDPYFGGELVYSRQLGGSENWRFGFDVALNYLNISLENSSRFSVNVSRTTDAYAFTPGTTPPTATLGSPYQGSYDGPGFLIDDTPISSSTAVIPGGTLAGRHEYNADLWGMRLGPYLELPLGTNWDLSISGGLAVGLLNSDMSWRESLSSTAGTATAAGHGNDTHLLWGFYLGANAAYRISEHWSVAGGAQYQNLGTYSHSFGGRKVGLDLGNAIFVTLGLSYCF